jgi:hypothetical protein
MEKDCKWHFKAEGGRDVGPNDPVDEKFKGQPYYSIVREAIQNSLDAVDDDAIPVKVEFSFFSISRIEFPNLFEIEDSIKQCLQYYSNNDNANRLFNNMLYYLNGDQKGMKQLFLTCLRISDYNTIGMYYNENDTKSPFYAFLRAGGVSAKSQSSGGSFGFGKGAYYTLSPIKTIIVSTRNKENRVLFEGSTILTTHKNEYDEKLTAYGYYDNNGGNPTQDEGLIPEIFKRETPGTDITIVGLWDEKFREKLMIKSVLNNFWLAIYDNKLVVKIGSVEINKNNLEQTIDEFFPEPFEIGPATEIECWNPKPYFKAVKYVNANEQFKLFKESLETIGEVKLYIYLDKELPNRTSYIRKPRMVVYKQTRKKISGYAAVFLCESDKGNKILRLMENPAHSEWKKENYPKDEGQINKSARKAEKEISDFINSKLEELSMNQLGNKLVFYGLEEYLAIPEDLLEKDEVYDYIGDNTNINSGEISKELTKDETAIQTTEINNVDPVTIKPTILQKPEVKNTEFVEQEGSEEKIITGGSNESDNGVIPGDGDLETGTAKVQDESTIKRKVLVQVRLKVAAQKENGFLFHHLIITTDKDITNSELELFVGADNDAEEKLSILESDKGSIILNKLINVKLNNGRNLIKIRFEDNIKHTLMLKAYEIQ